MEHQNLILERKLICDFMGIEPKKSNMSAGEYFYSDLPFFSTRGSKDEVMTSICGYLNFEKDWKLLISVLAKIKELGYYINMDYLSTEGYISTSPYSDKIVLAKVYCKENPFVSNPPTPENPIYIPEYNDPMEALYNLILRFIRYYNNQGKQTILNP
jgi:hypothetical protein